MIYDVRYNKYIVLLSDVARLVLREKYELLVACKSIHSVQMLTVYWVKCLFGTFIQCLTIRLFSESFNSSLKSIFDSVFFLKMAFPYPAIENSARTVSENTCEIENEMSEGNRKPTVQIRSELTHNDICSEKSVVSDRLRMRVTTLEIVLEILERKAEINFRIDEMIVEL